MIASGAVGSMGEEQPSELARLLTQGQAAHRNGEFARAEKFCGEILRLTSSHFEANHLLASSDTGRAAPRKPSNCTAGR